MCVGVREARRFNGVSTRPENDLICMSGWVRAAKYCPEMAAVARVARMVIIILLIYVMINNLMAVHSSYL